jgi:hypothetical protein
LSEKKYVRIEPNESLKKEIPVISASLSFDYLPQYISLRMVIRNLRAEYS